MTRMKTALALLAGFASVFAVAGLAPAATDEQGFVILQHADLDFGPDLSKMKTIVLHGNPDEPGLYIIRIRFPPGVSSRPHSHSTDRFVTVIQGTWYAGRGANYDMNDTVAIRPGGFMKHPAGAVHFDGAKDEAVIVEIRGMGPVKTTSAART